MNTQHTSVEHNVTVGMFVVIGLASSSVIVARSYIPQQQILDDCTQPGDNRVAVWEVQGGYGRQDARVSHIDHCRVVAGPTAYS